MAKNYRNAAILGVFYDTGMRTTELATILLANVNLDTGAILIPSASAKARRGRVVRLGPTAIRLVDRYLRRRDARFPQQEYLFIGRQGALTRTTVYDAIVNAFRAIGVTATISPHDLRHTSASHSAELMDESDLMALFGWRDSAMARHYTSQARAKLAFKAHEAASPLERLNR